MRYVEALPAPALHTVQATVTWWAIHRASGDAPAIFALYDPFGMLS